MREMGLVEKSAAHKKVHFPAGEASPLGATWDGNGVNFALYSANAERIDLCLFDNVDDEKESAVIPIDQPSHHVWHVYVPGLQPGQLYGYRVHGRYDPLEGHRFNHHKLLIDPYARAIAGEPRWNKALYGYEIGNANADLSFSRTNSAGLMPKCVVVDPQFDWQADQQVRVPLHDTLIYEAHVKGLTKLHPSIPENIRGTYSAICHPAMIEYYRRLHITTVELLPVHHFMDEPYLVDKGLCNYWGYNSIGFFAPQSRYSSNGDRGGQVTEFKTMVRTLHKSGIEVILDVVYNHTAEGNHLGPTLSFKGIDNAIYYRLMDEARYYRDFTGTGNTLDTRMPPVLKLIMDSLRYWVTEMHVDGFRFDLASALGREDRKVNMIGPFFDIIQQDPLLSQVKLIAEPWDVGQGGYQVGNFPPGWMEWNGKFRDDLRDFWHSKPNSVAKFATRFSGSPDLYKKDSRNPHASVNFITAHDGFTLHDLVSYSEKHNEANLDNNNDGENNNRSFNHGVEGKTSDDRINLIRRRKKRNFLAALFLSQGVPMLLSGDEIGNTQGGNNNAYCQDNELSWINWNKTDTNLLEFTCVLARLRRAEPILRHWRWSSEEYHPEHANQLAWFSAKGETLTVEQRKRYRSSAFAVLIQGAGLEDTAPSRLMVFVNSSDTQVDMAFPLPLKEIQWRKLLDTADENTATENSEILASDGITLQPYSMVVLKSADLQK